MRATHTAAEVAKIRGKYMERIVRLEGANMALLSELRGMVQETSRRANEANTHAGNVDRMLLRLPVVDQGRPDAPRGQGS